MVQFNTPILKFAQQGEKTGWTYIKIPAALAHKLKPGFKKSFRVKGRVDEYLIEKVALIPMGEGDFILPFNAAMRKGTGKNKGAQVEVILEVDDEPLQTPGELLECLEDEPVALQSFEILPQSHKNYFIKWIASAKTDNTKSKRIAHTINALCNGIDFGAMLRAIKEEREKLF